MEETRLTPPQPTTTQHNPTITRNTQSGRQEKQYRPNLQPKTTQRLPETQYRYLQPKPLWLLFARSGFCEDSCTTEINMRHTHVSLLQSWTEPQRTVGPSLHNISVWLTTFCSNNQSIIHLINRLIDQSTNQSINQ